MLTILAIALAVAGADASECAVVGPAPRTIRAPAASYASSDKFSVDEDGILVYDYGSQYGNIGKYRNPFFITDYALALYRDYLDTSCEDKNLKSQFLKQADHLIASGHVVNGALVWSYPFPVPAFDLGPGWISGIAQSRIAGVLQRAYVLTGDARYHEAAEHAMDVYYLPIDKGGVLTEDGGVNWYEEYAAIDAPSYKVLNGHITAVAGILDYFQITGEEKWKHAFDMGVEAVKRDLPKFDSGYLSYYSLASPDVRKLAARYKYNALHVSQLLWLYDETSDPAFLQWASHFEFYEENRDAYSAPHSTNAKTNGPEKVAGLYGNSYWSSSKFPAQLVVATGNEELFKGIEVQGSDAKSTPRDFEIDALVDGEWQTVATVSDNDLVQRRVDFANDIRATGFRINVAADNGNRNVAIQAFMPIRTDYKLAPMTNDCNYEVTGARNNLDSLFGEKREGMRISCPGWIVLPLDGQSEIDISSTAADGAKFRIAYSDDLAVWEDAGEVPANITFELRDAKFARLSFDTDVSKINEISLR